LPKCKCNQADNEPLDDSISTVKTAAIKKKKQLKPTMKSTMPGQQKKTSFKTIKMQLKGYSNGHILKHNNLSVDRMSIANKNGKQTNLRLI